MCPPALQAGPAWRAMQTLMPRLRRLRATTPTLLAFARRGPPGARRRRASATAWWAPCCPSRWSSRELGCTGAPLPCRLGPVPDSAAGRARRAARDAAAPGSAPCPFPACSPASACTRRLLLRKQLSCNAAQPTPTPPTHSPPLATCRGMWMALTFGDAEPTSWRPHGLMSPPENPFLREDMRPRVRSHWSKWQQQQAAHGEGRGGRAGLLPAAAAAAAGGAP